MTLAYADAHGALVDALDARVRELVRRDGVDPQAEVGLVRKIAEDAVRAHDQHSLTGQVAPVPDLQSMVGELVARVSGFGPLQPYLDDPDIEEIWINDPARTIGDRILAPPEYTCLAFAQVSGIICAWAVAAVQVRCWFGVDRLSGENVS